MTMMIIEDSCFFQMRYKQMKQRASCQGLVQSRSMRTKGATDLFLHIDDILSNVVTASNDPSMY